MTPPQLNGRLLDYAASVISLVGSLPRVFAAKHIGSQLLRCATSVGANYEKAQGAESRLDFAHKMQLALKECRESCFWLHLLAKTSIGAQGTIQGILTEGLQLRSILAKAVATTKSKSS